MQQNKMDFSNFSGAITVRLVSSCSKACY